jgi:uncharacterized membrane protein YgdD (TMEM256/DUF423 family)
MNRKFLITGALLAALAVVCGAFGAHFLKTKLTAEGLQIFETAVRYQFYHAFALLVGGILYATFPGKLLQWSGKLFIVGIILFSGSLYVLCGLSSMKWIGAVTPAGGLCFITGWILLAAACAKKN